MRFLQGKCKVKSYEKHTVYSSHSSFLNATNGFFPPSRLCLMTLELFDTLCLRQNVTFTNYWLFLSFIQIPLGLFLVTMAMQFLLKLHLSIT